MRICSAPPHGCDTLGMAALLYAPEEVVAHPLCHPPALGQGEGMLRAALEQGVLP